MRSCCLFYQESPWVISLKAVIVPDCGPADASLSRATHHTGAGLRNSRTDEACSFSGARDPGLEFFAPEIWSLESVTGAALIYAYIRIHSCPGHPGHPVPSFSSRSNNNNHSLFAYITPPPLGGRFELNSRYMQPALRRREWRVGREIAGNSRNRWRRNEYEKRSKTITGYMKPGERFCFVGELRNLCSRSTCGISFAVFVCRPLFRRFLILLVNSPYHPAHAHSFFPQWIFVNCVSQWFAYERQNQKRTIKIHGELTFYKKNIYCIVIWGFYLKK